MSPLPLDHGGPVCAFDPFPDTALDQGVVVRFGAILAQHAARLAVDDGGRSMTYAQVAGLAAWVSAALPRRDPTGPLVIGILLEHEARVPAAMLGVLAAGHITAVLDAGYPHDRLAAIARHAELGAIVCSGRLRTQAAALGGPEMLVVCIDLPSGTPPAVTRLDPQARLSAEDVASILYTSGSTGAPKGVFQDHRGLLHDVMQYANAIHLRPEDRLTLLYSPATAGAVRDIWGALLTGASLHPRDPRCGAATLAAFLSGSRPSVFHAVPVLLRHLAAAGGQFPSVRLGYVAGDRLDATDVASFFRLFPNALLYTGLGATEASTIYVHRFIAPGMASPGQRVPVGSPMPDRIVLLLDDDGRPVPHGTCGNIVVSSRYIARGYWKAPALTAERFTADPDRPGWRRFHTGDLGRIRSEDGMLEHLGRADHMVKLGGHRIELPAVEAAIKALPGVHDAVALVRRGAGAAARDALLVHWQPVSTAEPDHADAAGGAILAELRRRLPQPMIPAAMVPCGALPLLPNFKIDRAEVARRDAALAASNATAAPASAMPGAPRSADMVADEAALVLGMTRPPAPMDNLFALGMDSLALVAFLTALERRFDRAIPMEVMIAARTPARIGAWLDTTSPHAKPQAAGIATLRRVADPAAPPLLWPHDLSGDVFDRVYKLLPLMPENRDWFGLRDPAGGTGSAIADSVEDHAALMLATLRSAGLPPERGAIPIGYSFSGRLAWELASQMRASGWFVPQVIILDAPPWPTGIRPEAAAPATPRDAVRAHFYRLAAHYQARSAPLDIGLVRASGHFTNHSLDLGWGALARRLTIKQVPGNHALFKDERLAALATALGELLGTVDHKAHTAG